MTIDINTKEGELVRQLIPLVSLPMNQFTSLCEQAEVEQAEADTFLFKRHDPTEDFIYLIDGSISLQWDQFKVETINSGSESARFALAHHMPRKIDALTTTKTRFLRLNIALVDALPGITDQEDNNYMVTDETGNENNDDWMTTLLTSPIFSALPPANLQQILISLEEVNFQKGEKVVKQGDQGDYYYVIKKGRCLLSRKPSENAKEIKLAQLRNQDTFGEDSLLSDEPRNVSITALSELSLLRLNKEKFIELIKKPSLIYVSYSEIKEKLKNDALLIDVRSPDEYKERRLTHSINAPFFSLRMQLKSFDKNKEIMVVCDNGKTSEAAAFLLLRNSFKASILNGGIEKAPEESMYENTSTGFTVEKTINHDITTVSKEVISDKLSNMTEKNSNFSSEEVRVTVNVSEQNNQVNLLQQENLQLKQQIQQLKQAVQQRETENADLITKGRILFKQTEKLKAVLATLKK